MTSKKQETLPQTWISAPLGEIGRWGGGGTPSKSKPSFWKDGSIPWVSPKDMKVRRLFDSEDHITLEAIESSATNLISPGSVLIVTRSGILRHSLPIAVNEVEVTLNQDLKALSPFCDINPNYITWALESFEEDILHNCSKTGTTVQSIEFPRLLRFSIPLAPLPEQHRIVAKLEELFTKLDAGVEALRKARAQLGRYRQAVLKAAVTGELTKEWREAHQGELEPASALLARILKERREKWEADQLAKLKAAGKTPKNDEWKEKYVEPVELKEVDLTELPQLWRWARAEQLCDFITKGTTPAAHKLFSGVGEVPYIKVYNLTHIGLLDFTVNPTFVSRFTHNGELARSIVFAGDVLMNIVGPPLGKVSVVPDTYQEWNINQAIAIFRPMPSFNRKFLSICLLTDDIQRWAERRAKATAGQFNLTLEICRDLPLPLPPLAEQEKIDEEIERLLSIADAMEQTIEHSLKQSERLRQSILKQAFSGKLVPQDPSDEPAEVLLARIREERGKRAAAQPKKDKGRARKTNSASAHKTADSLIL